MQPIRGEDRQAVGLQTRFHVVDKPHRVIFLAAAHMHTHQQLGQTINSGPHKDSFRRRAHAHHQFIKLQVAKSQLNQPAFIQMGFLSCATPLPTRHRTRITPSSALVQAGSHAGYSGVVVGALSRVTDATTDATTLEVA